jgi:alkylation response protein AidB-like acyl-CoA dehydrogenase
VIEALREAGAFTMARPKQWGGAALMPSEQARVVEVVARGDGAAGWCVQIAAVSTMMLSRASLELQEEVFNSSRGPTNAGKAEPLPGCVARPVQGGWMVKGRWNFASTLDHADRLFGGALVLGEDGGGAPGVFFMPKRQEWVVDDWHVMGMAGSSSASFAFDEEVFVPAHRCMPLSALLGGAPPYAAEQPLFAVDVGMFAQTMALASAFGCYSAVCDIWDEITRRRSQLHPDFKLQAENPVTHLKAGNAAARRALVRTVLEKFSRSADADALGRYKLNVSETLENAAIFGEIMFDMSDGALDIMRDSGAGVIYLTHPMQRAVRDLIVTNMHAGANRDRHFEALGRHLYGLAPLSPFGPPAVPVPAG